MSAAEINLAPIGHEAQEAELLAQHARHQLPQTLLFHGPEGIGKRAFAYRLACYLLGGGQLESGLFGPAGITIDEASPIVGRVRGGSHADLLVISPEFSGQNQTPIIKVDAVRPIGSFLSKTAAEGDWRIVIIDGAEALNANAANALLKVVEEPPLNAVMILLTHQTGRLLPTLLSRCRKMQFRQPKYESFIDIIQNTISDISSNDLTLLHMLSHGSPGQALQLHDRSATQSYQQLISLFETYPKFSANRLNDIHSYIEKHAKSGGWAIWCQLWLSFLHRAALCAADVLAQEEFVSDDERSALLTLAAQRPADDWQQCYSGASELIRTAHGLHLDRKQVIQSLIELSLNPMERAA